MTRIYIAGPMSGLPDNNYPVFHAAAAKLRAQGHHVENPAEVATPPDPPTWENWMRLAIGQLITCDEIALLHGWSCSRGALLERKLALELNMPVRYLVE